MSHVACLTVATSKIKKHENAAIEGGVNKGRGPMIGGQGGEGRRKKRNSNIKPKKREKFSIFNKGRGGANTRKVGANVKNSLQRNRGGRVGSGGSHEKH